MLVEKVPEMRTDTYRSDTGVVGSDPMKLAKG
jgi:hypothetical protein